MTNYLDFSKALTNFTDTNTNTMNKYKITTDLTPRSSKPAQSEVGGISNSLNIVTEVSINEFSDMMQAGYTWSAGVFNGSRKNANWVEQSVFALDFDSGVTPDEIKDRFSKLSITPNVVYTSFSDTPELRKFRVVLFLDNVITDIDQRNYIQRGLMDLIGDVDIACKDAARLYFGGKQSEILNQDPISAKYLVESINCAVIASDSGKTRKVSKSVSKPHFLYNTIEDEVFRQDSQVRNFDFEKLAVEVELFRKFIDGEWLTHPQIFGLATAMIWIEGGLKLMKDTMIKYNQSGKTGYTANNFSALTYVKYMQYQPQRLSNYSPYESDKEHLNPITAVKEVRGMVELLHPIERMSLKDAEKLMERKFTDIIAEANNDIYIMKLPTGIGKTRLLETVTATIALPTNELKEEVYDRVAVKKVITPTLPYLVDVNLSAKLDYLYSVGLNDIAIKLIVEVSKDYKFNKYHEQDVLAIQEYLKHLRGSYVAKDVAVLTTHLRAIHSEFNSDTVIFDEDPLQSLLPIKSFNIGDFMKLEGERDLFSQDNEISAIIDYLRSVPKGQCLPTPQFSVDLIELVNKIKEGGVLTDVISFINSDFFIRDMHNPNTFSYISNKNLTDKKVIIMSATVSPNVYKALYGDRVKVIDFSDVTHTGKVIQHTAKSFSRESLRLSIDKIDRLVNTKLPSITFKEFVSNIQNGVDEMYFGNVSGYDSLKGRDINVIGTPHLHNSVYLLIANIIGLKLKPLDLVMEYRVIEWNGFKFKFNCYANEQLRDIQLSLIESELIQAVGRARALREDCNVFVYSNLPLRISTEFKK